MTGLARLLAAVVIARDRFRTGSGSLFVFVLLVTVTMVLAAAMPRLAGSALDDAARRSVAAAPAVARDLEFTRTDSLPPGTTEPLEAVNAAGSDLEAGLPASVRTLIAGRNEIVDSVEFVVSDPPVSITQLKFRIQSGLDDHIRWVEGRAPAATDEHVTLPGRVDELGAPYVADVYEIALSTAATQTVLLEVGDELLLSPDEDDLIVQRYGTLQSRGYVVARVVGRFDVVDAEDPYWFDDPGLRVPFREPISIELSIFHVGALVDPATYPRLVGVESLERPTSVAFPLRYTWRYQLDPGRLEAAALPALAADVTRLQARYPFSGANTLGAAPSLRWGMRDVLERHLVQQRTSAVTLTLAALGPIGTATGALALVALVVVRRREAGVRLLRSRGASTTQLLLAQTLETCALLVPAVAVATLATLLATPGPGIADAAVRAGLVGLATLGLVLGATVPATRGRMDAGDLAAGRTSEPRGRAWMRRLVFDGTVVAFAVIAVLTLRSRGLGSGTGPVAIDPLLAAVPILVAAAAGLLLLRVYPLPLRLIAAIAARGRGLIPTFPLWGAARQSRLAAVPLLVVLIATAIGSFSSVLLDSVRHGQLVASWRTVGADWRIDADSGLPVPSNLDPIALPGVDHASGVTEADGTVRSERIRRQQTLVRGVDPGTFRATTAPAALPFELPAEFDRPSWGPTTGTSDDPIPVLISPELATQATVGVGGSAFFTVKGVESSFRVVGIREVLPGRADAEAFIVAPVGALAAAMPGVDLRPTSYLVAGGPDLGPVLTTAIAPYGDLLHLRSRDAAFRALHETPLIAIVETGMAVALVIAVGYAGLALAAGLAIVLALRRRDLHVLRTLGLSHGAISSTIVIEQIPLVLVAMVGGGVVGIVLALLMGPSVGLATYTDELPSIPMVVDPAAALAVGILPMAVAVLAALLSGWFVRRSDLARAVRFNEG